MPSIYIHVPFCDGKCPYCDFYSLSGSASLFDEYTAAVCASLRGWAEKADFTAETVYFGGGTPSLLGAERLTEILRETERSFGLAPGAEVTLEVNPNSVDLEFFLKLRQAGFNRVSMGLQSANADELKLLGRRHSVEDVTAAVKAARSAGFENISLDLMLGLPNGSSDKLKQSIEFAAGLDVEHISSYILKIEDGTPFAVRGIELPDGDETAEQYLFCVDELARHGYRQYEISNFSLPGRESRHNLVYWHGDEYLGIGPGAHSFYHGKRFFYPRDLSAFISGGLPVQDGDGGYFEEYAMLNLRLSEGLQRSKCVERFGAEGAAGFAAVLKNTEKCPKELLCADDEKICFTPQGFLLSNALLVKLLEI